MNALLSKERAIVSPFAGTTRDILEDHLRLSGLNLLLTDTAGIRETEELIEMEGIRRSRQAMQEADLILLLLDASRPLSEEDRALLQVAPKAKTIVVWNKIDCRLPVLASVDLLHIVEISALHKKGLDSLLAQIDQVIWLNGPPSKEEIVITNVRHKEALQEAEGHIQKVIEGLKQDVSAEFVAFDMRQTLVSLGKILGANVTEDILSAIFSKFCIGK